MDYLGLVLDCWQVGGFRHIQQCATKDDGKRFHDVTVSVVHPSNNLANIAVVPGGLERARDVLQVSLSFFAHSRRGVIPLHLS